MNKLPKLEKLMIDADGHGYYQADDADPSEAVCEYSKAQAREAALVEALRNMMGTPDFVEMGTPDFVDWQNARAVLAQIDAEKGGAK